MSAEPSISLRQVRAIDAVAVHSGLSRASIHLGVSQSSLSRLIAEAEKTLRRRLFARGWSGMEPTSEGEVVIAHCRRMIGAIDDAQAKARLLGASHANLAPYLTWDLLQICDVVIARGSVTAAARELGISQASVSRGVARLSAGFGVPLMRRTAAGLAATTLAGLLAGLHPQLQLQLHLMGERLDALQDQVTGRISVGLLPFSEQDTVSRAFGEVLTRYRHVRLQAVTGNYATLIEALRRGDLDFIFGVLRQPPPFDTLEERPLYQEAFTVVARTGHPALARGTSLGELARANWIVAPHGTPSRLYFENWLRSAGVTPPTQTCEIVTFNLAEQLILHSDALGLLTYSDRKLAALPPGLRLLRVDLPDSRRMVGLTLRRDHPLNPAQQHFMNFLTDEWQPGQSVAQPA